MTAPKVQITECTDANTPLLTLKGTDTYCKALNVHDGDTLKLALDIQGTFVKIIARIKGIDTPELSPPQTLENRKELVERAFRARNRLIQLVSDANISLEDKLSKADITMLMNKNKRLIRVLLHEADKYGRTLVEFPDDNIASKLIEEGLAFHYDGGRKQSFGTNSYAKKIL